MSKDSLLVRSTRTLVALLVAATLAGCGDDDGASPFAPEKDLAGMWVRYVPGPENALPVALLAPLTDTLYLGSDGTGTWSIAIPGGMGPMPGRLLQHVWTEPTERLIVDMWAIPDPCEACRPGEFRLAPSNWVIVRKGADRIEVRVRLAAGLESATQESSDRLGEDVYHYARRTPATRMPD